MKYSSVLLFFTILILGLSSCGKKLSHFTQSIYNDFDWTENELKRIQFYLSDDIVLYRQLRAEDSRITNGKIRVKNGSEVEEIVFEKGTPGVLIFSPEKNRFAISFESNDDFLMFGPNPKAGGRYLLLAKDWSRSSGKVTYKGKTYETSTESAYAALLVDIKKLQQTKYKRKKVEGRTVRGGK